MANPRPKFKLRGNRKTNVTVHRDGGSVSQTLEPGKVYEGDEYHRWVPRILVPIDPTVKVENLHVPEAPPHRRGLRRMRRTLAPQTAPGMKVKATLEKKHVRRPRPKAVEPKPAPAAKADAQAAEKKKAEAMAKGKEKKRLQDLHKAITNMTKEPLLDAIAKEGLEDRFHHRDTVPEIRKRFKALITKKIKFLG